MLRVSSICKTSISVVLSQRHVILLKITDESDLYIDIVEVSLLNIKGNCEMDNRILTKKKYQEDLPRPQNKPRTYSPTFCRLVCTATALFSSRSSSSSTSRSESSSSKMEPLKSSPAPIASPGPLGGRAGPNGC